MPYIPYGKHEVLEEDIKEVVKVLKSDFITQGEMVPKFEKAVSDYCGAKYAKAVNSGTSALHIACLSLGLRSGDYLWTSPISFVASANCGLYCGAKIDFVDINKETYNISIDNLKKKLKEAKKKNNLPKILIPVHLAGQSCEMEEIYKLSVKYGFKIIEDASHAIGGRYLGKPVGNCKYSHLTVFSFHPVKGITTGEGGMFMTNSKELFNKLDLFRSHGVSREEFEVKEEQEGSWYYEQIDLGYNYRMNDMQAALGLSQLNRLDKYIEKRHKIADRYNNLLANLPISIPKQSSQSYSGMHLYIIRLKLDEINASHLSVFESMRENGIGVNLHYIPIYKHPYYRRMTKGISDLPEAEKYYKEAISLPIFPKLKVSEQEKVVSTLKAAISK